MKQQIYAPSVPTVNITVNKSRIKLYSKGVEMPTYYLQKGQEFQFELFNPTTDIVLAKIILNGKPISQGGLVLNPGQRVFLERYLDVPKKFLFDTYEVSNSEEVKKAIEKNGDVKVEFFRESYPYSIYTNVYPDWTYRPQPSFYDYPSTCSLTASTYTTNGVYNTSTIYDTNSLYSANINRSDIIGSLTTASAPTYSNPEKFLRKAKLSKSIETGRVDKGSTSNQDLKYVDKTFDLLPFHTIEYKLLPVSQKINTVEDINVKRYCTNCAHKLKNGYKFCPACSTKV